MSYMISIEQGFNLFRKSIEEKNQQQYSLWFNTINMTFNHILLKAYINGTKKFEDLREILINFLNKYRASDLFIYENLCNFILEKIKDFECADLLILLKNSKDP